MNLLSDVITYIRRIIKSPSNSQITDNLLIDYINRFWIMDVDARIQLFDLKTKYQFQTVPGVDQYNMPLYSTQSSTAQSAINLYPVYQGFTGPARIGGVPVQFDTQKSALTGWENYVQTLSAVAVGNGGSNYNIQLPFVANSATTINQSPSGILRGHVDIAGVIYTGNNVDPPLTAAGPSTNFQKIPVTSVYSSVFFTTTDATGANAIVQDSGQFLVGNVNYGLMMRPGPAPFGNVALNGGYSTTVNTINYATGAANITFTDSAGAALNIPAGQNINAQCYFFNPGLPRSILFYNNILTLRSVPFTQYLVELDAYLTPAAFLSSSDAVPFGYMSEYIARGAARKILADTGDTEQFMFYEPLFREQETLVWKRSQRQFTSTRTQTIFSQGEWGQGQVGNINSIGML
jgi:hypothetical protein